MANNQNLIPNKSGKKVPGSGRKKGKPNRLTELKTAIEAMKDEGLDPTVGLIELLRKTGDNDLKFKILTELKRYQEAYKQKTDIDLTVTKRIIVDLRDDNGTGTGNNLQTPQTPKTDL
jgi:hypothetical protein